MDTAGHCPGVGQMQGIVNIASKGLEILALRSRALDAFAEGQVWGLQTHTVVYNHP